MVLVKATGIRVPKSLHGAIQSYNAQVSKPLVDNLSSRFINSSPSSFMVSILANEIE